MIAGLAFAAGATTWLLAEYLIHRFVGHAPGARNDFSMEHRRHHAVGHYFAPARKKLLTVAPVVAAIGAGASLAVGPALGLAYTGGLAATYLLYEVLHRRLHTSPPRTAYGRWARRHHFHHHFEDPRSNHGVTTPLGDLFFATRARSARIRVPIRLAMPWLIDPQSGDVRAEHAADYELRR